MNFSHFQFLFGFFRQACHLKAYSQLATANLVSYYGLLMSNSYKKAALTSFKNGHLRLRKTTTLRSVA